MLNYLLTKEDNSIECFIENPFNESEKINIAPLLENIKFDAENSFKVVADTLDNHLEFLMFLVDDRDFTDTVGQKWKEQLRMLYMLRDSFSQIAEMQRGTLINKMKVILNEEGTTDDEQQ